MRKRIFWRPRWRRRSSGFTIVEVLVAMTVSAVGMVAVLGALRVANDATDRVRDETAAATLAERHMVGLLAAGPDEMNPTHGEEGKFSWEEKVQASKVAGMASIRVVVKWSSCGRPATFELVSMRETQ